MKYPILLYLNQKYVFDLLAMMEDGLSYFETVKSTQNAREDQSSKITGEVGVKNVFAFLGVSLGADRTRAGQKGESQEILKERVHTPNSLFSKVRERLQKDGLVTSTKLIEARPGDFVEFSATLQKNPLIDALESIRALFGTALIFEEPKPGTSNQPKGINQRQPQQQSSNKQILSQFDLLLTQLNGEGSLDLIGRVVSDKDVQVVLTIDRAFLADPSMSDLVDGEFTVLGKVTKVITDDSGASLNLLRKTSLGRVQGAMLEQMKDGFSGAGDIGIAIPEIVTEIRGPAVQVLPIGVYT